MLVACSISSMAETEHTPSGTRICQPGYTQTIILASCIIIEICTNLRHCVSVDETQSHLNI